MVAVGPETGQHSDQGAEKDARQAIQQVGRGECDSQTYAEVGNQFHTPPFGFKSETLSNLQI